MRINLFIHKVLFVFVYMYMYNIYIKFISLLNRYCIIIILLLYNTILYQCSL